MKLPQIIPMILDQTEEELQNEWRPPKVVGSYRGSELGDCPRYIQYSIRGYKPEPVSPELGLLFKDGHLHHDALRTELSKVGILTNREHPLLRQFTFGGQTFTITGTLDGVFDKEFVLDIKSINPFSFKKLTKEYIWNEYRGYVYQIQMYLELLDKKYGFILFKDKAFSALKVFWYKKDPVIIDKILKKIAGIHKATVEGKWIKRPFKKGSKECERCPMRKHCWGVSMKRRTWR